MTSRQKWMKAYKEGQDSVVRQVVYLESDLDRFDDLELAGFLAGARAKQEEKL